MGGFPVADLMPWLDEVGIYTRRVAHVIDHRYRVRRVGHAWEVTDPRGGLVVRSPAWGDAVGRAHELARAEMLAVA